jgi:hypothetical protein
VHISAQAVGPSVFHLARLIRGESNDRRDQFVPDKFSLSGQRRRAATSAIKSPRARPLARSSIETYERFVMSRRSSSQQTGFHIKADEIAEALIFRPKVLFQLAPQPMPTPRARGPLGSCAAMVSELLNIIISRIPTAGAAASRANRRGKNS